MKKTRSLLLAGATAALAAVLAIGGSLAYYTDRDAKTNVFTVGNVDIELTEDFEQGAELMPGVKIEKEPAVTNTGKNDAWVWATIAIPSALDNEDASKNVVHFNFSKESVADGNWNWGDYDYDVQNIDGVDYNVYTILHESIVKPGESTLPVMTQVYMDYHVDIDPNGDWYHVENGVVEGPYWNSNDGNPLIYVNAYGIQADTFENVDAAYEAYKGQWVSLNGKHVEPTVVTDNIGLKDALTAGAEYIILGDDIGGDGEPIVVPAEVETNLILNGNTITNAVAGAPAIINNGTLTIGGDGAIVNGVNSTKASHTIENNGTLTINDGKIGTDDTAGAAVVNYGTATINGGTFASKQENVKADGLCAYAFINHRGTMTIANATLNGQTHGLFGAYGGEIIVNDGNYTMDGNSGLGCYVVYATGEGKVTLNGGTINTNEPRSNRVFFVYDNGNYFNAAAVETGKVVVNGATIYLNGTLQTY